MVYFYSSDKKSYYLVASNRQLDISEQQKLSWLFGEAKLCTKSSIEGLFAGPRKEMITPWSTNAVEITVNMGIRGIERIERFRTVSSKNAEYDPMLEAIYDGLDENTFTIEIKPEPVRYIDDIAAYNLAEGLAMSNDEVAYLESISKKIKRKLTDSEIYGFAQINSEH